MGRKSYLGRMKIVYLIQTKTGPQPYSLPPDSDFLSLQWGSEFDCGQNTFHLPNSTWMSGRNELFRRALLKDEYDYFVFLDDDISFSYLSRRCRFRWGVGNGFRALLSFRLQRALMEIRDAGRDLFRSESSWFLDFESCIRKYRPALATCPCVGHGWDLDRGVSEIENVSYGDHICIAYHKSVVFDLFPYNCDQDSRANWWISSEDMSRRAFALCPNSMVRFNRQVIVNGAHNEYPQDVQRYKYPTSTVSEVKPELVEVGDVPKPTGLTPLDWQQVATIVTSIHEPSAAIEALDAGCKEKGAKLIVVGDRKSPPIFEMEHGQFLSIHQQLKSEFKLAKGLPENHYARKNLGYLYAISLGVSAIIDIDDDNIPLPSFWRQRFTQALARITSDTGWVNAYRYFSHDHIWPRGMPLEKINKDTSPVQVEKSSLDVFVHQGLAQGDPDVDAICRLTQDKAFYFREAPPLYLKPSQWCPINSQNTLWVGRAIFALLYLPSTCRFRETDIIRGFVAQRVLWAMGTGICFQQADVIQERNEHNLLADLDQESRLYQKADEIRKSLETLELDSGESSISTNMKLCYQALLALEMVETTELDLLDVWFQDLDSALS